MVKDCVYCTYDGSFPGFLSVIFAIYKWGWEVESIDPQHKVVNGLFVKNHNIKTEPDKAIRVLKAIVKSSDVKVARSIYKCILSEQEGIEIALYHLIKEILSGNPAHFHDYRRPHIMKIHKTLKMMRREVHRMHAFVRFQELMDGTYAATIAPDFDVIPLIGKHFKARYPTMEWVIFDTKRQYGIHYQNGTTSFVAFKDKLIEIELSSISNAEKDYQVLWKQYFESVNIKERNNERLHLRHVPKRYWRYLIEKQ